MKKKYSTENLLKENDLIFFGFKQKEKNILEEWENFTGNLRNKASKQKLYEKKFKVHSFGVTF